MYNKRPPITKKKMIEIGILIVIILWVLIFMINYFRYTKDQPPIFAIKLGAGSKCDDGTVTQYYGVGYVYRKYVSTSTNYSEFVPFWKGRKPCQESNGLPIAPTNFDIPNNPGRETKYRGLAYFYTNKVRLVGAYKCLNTEDECDVAQAGYDSYNIIDADGLYKVDPKPHMYSLFDTYGFVDDSVKQDLKYGDKQYIRTIYYYDFINHKILYKFGDVKYSSINEYDMGYAKDNRYIIRDYDSSKWGLLEFSEDGKYKEILKMEYDSINYDEDTGYYILLKDNKWSIYDLDNDKYVLSDMDDVIYDVWQNGNLTYYYKTGITYEGNTTFKIFNINRDAFLDKDNIVNVIASKKFVAYVNGKERKIHIIDYTATEYNEPIKLYFLDLDHDRKTHPAFEYEISSNYLAIIFKVYKGRELKYDFERYSISTTSWK